jgi:hypothetical protein
MQTASEGIFRQLLMHIRVMFGADRKRNRKASIVPGIFICRRNDPGWRYRGPWHAICGMVCLAGLVLISSCGTQKSLISSGGPFQAPDRTDTSAYYGGTRQDYPPSHMLPAVRGVSLWDGFKGRCSEIFRRFGGSPSGTLPQAEVIRLPQSQSGPIELKLPAPPPLWTGKLQ